MADIDAARELLRDSFTRLIELSDDLTDGLTDQVAYYRPSPDANTVTWLLWHSARMQDAQVCDIAGVDQIWFREGWVDRFDLDLPRDTHGYGQTPEEVAKVRASPELLGGYYRAVHRATLAYVASVSADELERVIDERWTPPVTAGARLVSIVLDAAQHLGQAAYVRGLVPTS